VVRTVTDERGDGPITSTDPGRRGREGCRSTTGNSNERAFVESRRAFLLKQAKKGGKRGHRGAGVPVGEILLRVGEY